MIITITIGSKVWFYNETAVQAKIPTKWNFRNLQKSKKYNIRMYKKAHVSRVSVLHFLQNI